MHSTTSFKALKVGPETKDKGYLVVAKLEDRLVRERQTNKR